MRNTVFRKSARARLRDAVYDAGCAVTARFRRKSSRPRTMRQHRRVELIFIWSVLAMSLIQIAIFWVYGNASSIFLAFRDETGPEITYGLQNFKYIFNELTNSASQLIISIKNTLIFFVFGFFVQTPLVYLFSYFIYKKIPGYKVFRFIFFLPAVLSAVVMTSFYKFMFSPGGPMSEIWRMFTGEAPIFFSNSDYALKLIVIYNIWSGVGPGLLYYVATFSRIPDDVLEYARIDGVNSWQEVRYFILPLTWPFFSTMLFISLTGIMGSTGPILLFTQGQYNTSTIDYWMYVNTTGETSLPYAAAFGLFLTCINMPIAILFRWLANRVETVDY